MGEPRVHTGFGKIISEGKLFYPSWWGGGYPADRFKKLSKGKNTPGNGKTFNFKERRKGETGGKRKKKRG